MNRIFQLIFVALVITITSCSPKKDVQGSVTPSEVSQLKATHADLIILDVRTPQETAQGMIDGAIEMDISQPDFNDKVNQLDKGKPVLVYCAAGVRSARAQLILKNAGFNTVYNLEGGVQAWEGTGLPLK